MLPARHDDDDDDDDLFIYLFILVGWLEFMTDHTLWVKSSKI